MEVPEVTILNKKSIIHVLHVDDDSSLLEISKLMLLDLCSSFEIDQASCVDEALGKLKEGHYDVVISDYEMPQKDGLQFLKKLREQNNDIPFILFTGKGREEVAIEALNLGADGYINKQGSPETVYGELAHRTKLSVFANNDKIALRNSEFKFQTIADCANDWVYWLDAKQQFVYVSPSCEKITGYTPEEFYRDSQLINRIIDREDENLVTSLFEEHVDQVQQFEFKIVTKTGIKRWLSHNCAPVRDAKGNFLGRRVANRDITEQKCVQDAIRASEEKYRQLVECSADGIFTINLSGKINWANNYAMKLLGYSENDLPVSLLKVIPAKYLLKAMKLFSDGLRGKVVTVPFNLEVYTKSRERILVSYRGTLLHDEKGKVTGILGVIRDFQEKKKIEKSLIDSEERFRSLIETNSDFVWETDSQGRYTYCSPQMEILWGFKPQEMIGKTPFDMMPAEDRKYSLEFFGKIANSPKPFKMESSAYNSQGHLVYLETNGVPFFDSQGVLLGFRGISRDNTEHKKTEEKIREIEKRSKAIIDNSPVGIVSVGMDRLFLSANETFCKILGYNEEELLKLTFKEITYPADLKESVKKMGELENGKISSFLLEKRYVKKDGALIDGRVMVSVLRNQNGIPEMFIAQLEDVTERTKAEEIMKENANLLAESGRVGKVGGWQFNIDTLQQTWTDETYRIHEVDHNFKPTVENGLSFYTPDSRPIIEQAVQQTVEYGVPFDLEMQIATAKGNLRNVRAVGEANLEKRVVYGFFQDITEMKETEKLLKTTIDKMEILTEKMRVVGGLTRHDVGNKLMLISSNIYLLKKLIGDNPKLTKYLESIDSAISQSEKIFEFSRFYEKIGAEKSVNVDVFECFNVATTIFSNLRPVKIVNECQGLQVVADSLLRQLFYNLIDNSLKHGKKVTQICLHYIKMGDVLNLFYEDNGVGISLANKSKLFDPGFTTGKGSGLGLYLVKKMIEVYGWQIEENGEPGKGATFIIIIPKHNKNGKENYQIVE